MTASEPKRSQPWRAAATAAPIELAPGNEERQQPDFGIAVPAGGYAWWYIDGISDDGRFGFTVIAFVGSVFSPYYAWARRRQGSANANPEQHVAINAVLYQPNGGKRWAMTERSGVALQRGAQHYQLGPSELRWADQTLTIQIDERCAPFGQRLRGTIKVSPSALSHQSVCLSAEGDHRWQPIAAKAPVTVTFDSPDICWSGDAYFDHNSGSTPLESVFKYWTWSRAHDSGGTQIDYEVWRRNGEHALASLHIDGNGELTTRTAQPYELLPGTGWRIDRNTRIADAKVSRTLEDTPFYARSVLQQSSNQANTIVCEHLDLQRFGAPWVQMLLPFRMPRRSGA